MSSGYSCASLECKNEFQSLENMFYCPDCGLKCSDCVHHEIVCFYCPSCLFEVPSASVKAEQSRCGRNCFECPLCMHTLIVHQLDSGCVYLSCTFCMYNSTDAATFDRPTGLASQLQKQLPDSVSKEFLALKDYYEKLVKSSAAPKVNPYLRLGPAPKLIEPFKSTATSHLSEPGMVITASKISLSQCIQQPEVHMTDTKHALPLRVNLQSKMSKKCKSCKKVLVKPEGKSSSIKFTVGMFARKNIVHVQYGGLFRLKNGNSFERVKLDQKLDQKAMIYLKLVNPFEKHTQVVIKFLNKCVAFEECSVVLLGNTGENANILSVEDAVGKVYRNGTIESHIIKHVGHVGIPIELSLIPTVIALEVGFQVKDDERNDVFTFKLLIQ